MKKPNLVMGVLGLALSLAVIYGTVYIAGKAWKKSQKN
jgi:hypothetical protein